MKHPRTLALLTLLAATSAASAQSNAQAPAPSPWATPAPLPPDAVPPPANAPPAATTPPGPAPLPPIRPAARRRMSYSGGLMLGAAIPLTGSVSRGLDPGFTFLLGGSDEFSPYISGRLEVGIRYHNLNGLDESVNVLFLNTAGRFYFVRDAALRPYLGAHLGYQFGFSESALRGDTLITGFSIGASVGLTYNLSDTFSIGAEGRLNAILGFGGGGGTEVVTGAMLDVLAGVTVYIP